MIADQVPFQSPGPLPFLSKGLLVIGFVLASCASRDPQQGRDESAPEPGWARVADRLELFDAPWIAYPDSMKSRAPFKILPQGEVVIQNLADGSLFLFDQSGAVTNVLPPPSGGYDSTLGFPGAGILDGEDCIYVQEEMRKRRFAPFSRTAEGEPTPIEFPGLPALWDGFRKGYWVADRDGVTLFDRQMSELGHVELPAEDGLHVVSLSLGQLGQLAILVSVPFDNLQTMGSIAIHIVESGFEVSRTIELESLVPGDPQAFLFTHKMEFNGRQLLVYPRAGSLWLIDSWTSEATRLPMSYDGIDVNGYSLYLVGDGTEVRGEDAQSARLLRFRLR